MNIFSGDNVALFNLYITYYIQMTATNATNANAKF